jgi:hypothetical protein
MITIYVSRATIRPFKIERVLKQGYPLAPYLFILVGEILNFMVKEVIKMGDIKGAMLPRKAIKNYKSLLRNFS